MVPLRGRLVLRCHVNLVDADRIDLGQARKVNRYLIGRKRAAVGDQDIAHFRRAAPASSQDEWAFSRGIGRSDGRNGIMPWARVPVLLGIKLSRENRCRFACPIGNPRTDGTPASTRTGWTPKPKSDLSAFVEIPFGCAHRSAAFSTNPRRLPRLLLCCRTHRSPGPPFLSWPCRLRAMVGGRA